MSDIRDIKYQRVRDTIGTMALGNADLARSTNNTGIEIQAAFDFTIGGRVYTKAAADNIALTAAPAQPVLTSAYYLLSVNAAGTVTTTAGTSAASNPAIPVPPDGQAVFGAIKVDLAEEATFTPGTTALNATNVTATFYNLTRVPSSL